MSTPCYGRHKGVHSGVIPCNITAVENGEHSACCGYDDLCLSNGLCQNPGDRRKGSNMYWRIGCTDPTYQDAACPKFCSKADVANDKNAVIFKCQDEGSWCCKSQDAPLGEGTNLECCNIASATFEDRDVSIFATAQVQTVPISSLSSAASSSQATRSSSTLPSSSASGTPSPSSSNTPEPPDNSSRDLKLGLGISLPLAAALGIAILAFLILRRRKARTRGTIQPPAEMAPNTPALHETGGCEKYELSSQQTEIGSELDGQAKPTYEVHELSSEAK